MTRPLSTISRISERLLIVGDGDLSYAAMMAPMYQSPGQQLIATVLESEQQHHDTYTRGSMNSQLIQNHGHTVRFGVDATVLERHFESGTVDVIHWNFPHWNGKTNIQKNRQLMTAFMKSAHLVEIPRVQLAVMQHQGGSNCVTIDQWNQSWQLARCAACHGYLLSAVHDFDVTYPTSSYKSRDAEFRFHNKDTKLYTFVQQHNDGQEVPEELQLYCYYQIMLRLEENSADVLYQCHEIQSRIQQVLPKGWRAMVQRKTCSRQQTNGVMSLVYMVALFGVSTVMTQATAEKYRVIVQAMLQRNYPSFVTPSKVWPVSKPLPATLILSWAMEGWKDKSL
jgi:hypothetical protein